MNSEKKKSLNKCDVDGVFTLVFIIENGDVGRRKERKELFSFFLGKSDMNSLMHSWKQPQSDQLSTEQQVWWTLLDLSDGYIFST